MTTVDLREKDGGVSPKYLNVPQPMYIFHSKKELKDYITKNELKTFHIIGSVGDFLNFTKKYNLQGRNKFAQVSEINVFLATEEKFIPDTVASKGSEKGIIRWVLDKEGRVVSTDNCFIQLHLLFSARNHYLCFCSNGVESLSLSKWSLTAALKDQFSRPVDFSGSIANREDYDSKLRAVLERKKINVRDVRLFHLLFNPLSDTFLKADESVKRIYGGTIRKADREKLFQTERFRKLFRKELAYLMSNLQEAFKTDITDSQMVDMAKEIFGKALKDGSVDDSLKVYDAILNIRESEENIPATAGLIEDKNIKLVDANKGFKLKKPEKEDEVKIELLDEIPEHPKQPAEKEMVEHNEFTQIKPPFKLTEDDKKKKAVELAALKKDASAVDYEGIASLSELPELNDL